MKNILILTLFCFLVLSLSSQTINGVGLGTSVAAVTSCVPSPGAAVTLCPVTGDGLYMSVGSGSFQKVFLGTPTGTTDYQQLTNKPTTISCGVSSQSNTGFTASQCTLK